MIILIINKFEIDENSYFPFPPFPLMVLKLFYLLTSREKACHICPIMSITTNTYMFPSIVIFFRFNYAFGLDFGVKISKWYPTF